MLNVGDFLLNKTVYIPFNTYDGDGASITVTNLVAGDVKIHKNGGTTQRSSASGITVSVDFDSITGNHLIVIDLSDNDDAGFYARGADYKVRLEGITVATQTLNPWVAVFSIENRSNQGLLYDGGIWIDSGAANNNTVPGVDGLRSNKVSTFGAARTLADALGFQKYYITNGSALTLAATHQWWEFIGVGRAGNIINLGSQDVDNSRFENLSLAGTQGGSTFMQPFRCNLTSLVSLRPQAFQCCVAGNITILSGTMLKFEDCSSLVPGNTAPILTLSAGATGLSIRDYSGGWELKSMTVDHTVSLETDGQVILNADCTGGNLTLRGMMSITDNSGNVTITKDAVYNKQEARDVMKVAPTAGAPAAGSVDAHLDDIEADTNELQTDWENGGRLDLILNAIKNVTDFLVVKKNTVKNNFKFPMVLASDHISDANSLTVVCQRSIDGGVFANCTNTPAIFISDGTYKINLSAADLNGDVIMLKFTSATADTRKMLILTVP